MSVLICACTTLVIQLNTHQVIYDCECAYALSTFERLEMRFGCDLSTHNALNIVSYWLEKISNQNECWFCVSRSHFCIHAFTSTPHQLFLRRLRSVKLISSKIVSVSVFFFLAHLYTLPSPFGTVSMVELANTPISFSFLTITTKIYSHHKAV